MNVDIGSQSNGGENAVVLGNVANSLPCEGSQRWELKQVSGTGQAIEVTSDRAGAVWFFVGTDSGFEATTSLYYTWITAAFEPL